MAAFTRTLILQRRFRAVPFPWARHSRTLLSTGFPQQTYHSRVITISSPLGPTPPKKIPVEGDPLTFRSRIPSRQPRLLTRCGLRYVRWRSMGFLRIFYFRSSMYVYVTISMGGGGFEPYKIAISGKCDHCTQDYRPAKVYTTISRTIYEFDVFA